MAFSEFQPPSDFVPEGPKGGSNIWKLLGIGCLIVVLILGLALAFGAWKTVSCCNTMGDMIGRSTGAVKFAVQLGEELKVEDFDAAHARFSPALASKISTDDLVSERKEYARFFDSAEPRAAGMSALSENVERPRWEVRVELSNQTDRQKLLLLVEVDDLTPDHSDEPVFQVSALRFEQRDRDLAAEPPGIAVVGFHQDLRRGNDEEAFERLDQSFGDISAFRAFLKEQQPIFRSGAPEVLALDYSDERHARVQVLLSTRDDESLRVDYMVRSSGAGIRAFKITAIEPIYSDETDREGADAGGEEGDSRAKELLEDDEEAGERLKIAE